MYNNATVIGNVVEVIRDDRATIVIVADRTDPEKQRHTAVRFWSDKSRQAADSLAEDTLVCITGYCSSRKSERGSWFTDFNGSFVKVIAGAPF